MGDIQDPSAPRFLANTPDDGDLLWAMTRADFINASGTIRPDGDINLFSPN